MKYRYYMLGIGPGVDTMVALNQAGQNGWEVVHVFEMRQTDPVGGAIVQIGGVLLKQGYEGETPVPPQFTQAFQNEVPPPA